MPGMAEKFGTASGTKCRQEMDRVAKNVLKQLHNPLEEQSCTCMGRGGGSRSQATQGKLILHRGGRGGPKATQDILHESF